MMRLVLDVGIERFLSEIAGYIEEDFRRWPLFDKTPRVASHSAEGVIELMPTSDGHTYGFKYVNGHPKNTKDGLQTVTCLLGLLANVDTGYPVLLSEMTMLTATPDRGHLGCCGQVPGAEGRRHHGDHRQRRPGRVPGPGLQGFDRC